MKYLFLIYAVAFITHPSSEDVVEEISVELELSNLDIVDKWDEISQAVNKSLFENNDGFLAKVFFNITY